MHLVARLHPNLPGELERSSNPLAAIRGGVLLLRGRGEEGMGRARDFGEKREEEGIASSLFNFWLWA